MKTMIVIVSLAAFMGLSGCTTVREQRRRQTVREQSDLDALRMDVSRLRERIEGIDGAQEDLYRQIEELRASLNDNDHVLKERLVDTERRLEALGEARVQDRQYIIDSLSKKISGLMNAPTSRSAQAVQGREHVVQQGETLSAIASAYGSTMNAVIKANGLKNPDAIRVGQKLFIPE